MKKFYYVSAIFFLSFLIILVSCSNKGSEYDFAELTNWQQYVIVRPDSTSDAVVKAAISIVKSIEGKMGIKPDIKTDWVNKGEEVPSDTYEILVGNTNRPESEFNLAYSDFIVKPVGKRLVINGGSEAAIIKAAEWFVENCISDKVLYPKEGYTYNAEYPYKDVKIGGVLLSEFSVDGGKNYINKANELKQFIAEHTGVYPKDGGKNKIMLTNDPSLGMLDISVKLDAGILKIATAENGVDITEAVNLFLNSLNTRNDNNYIPDERMTIEMDSIKICTEAKIKAWRDKTDERINKILTSENMEIPQGAKVYYVSENGDDFNDGLSPEKAWKTLTKVNSAPLVSGSYVCFERGGLWRGNLQAKSGVTYTAYGEGDKPKIYGSLFDGADPSKWSKTDAENIWVINIGTNDCGTLVFNHGEAHAIKCIIRTESDGSTFNNTTGEPFKDYHDLTTDLHFYHDYKDSGNLYLYSKQNPGDRFDSIEFNVKPNIISIKGNNVTIDNLCIKYGGAHGVGAGTVSNLTVKNCEFGWIGGSIQAEGIYGRNYATRYGNAVEIYGGCNGFYVTDNYIYQIYDAGITQQYTLTEEEQKNGIVKDQKNMYYARNVIEYCNYSIEYFLGIGSDASNKTRMENFLIEDNYMWYAGTGFSQQRPDKTQGAHIKGWSGGNRNRATGYVVRNNLMFDSSDMLVQIVSPLYNSDGSNSMPRFENNDFVGRNGASFGTVAITDTTRQTYGTSIPAYLGEITNGDIFWFID
jgi:hypothetical protein